MRHIFCFVLSICLFFFSISVTAKQPEPVFSAYPNAQLRNSLQQDYEQYRFFLTADSSEQGATLDTAGGLYQHFYVAANSSSVQLFENYLAAAKQAGFTVVFQCQEDACGDRNQAKALGAKLSLENTVYNYYRNPYYLLVERGNAQEKLYAAWFIGAYEDEVAVQQVVLKETPLKTGLVKVNQDQLASAASQLEPTEQASAKELAKDHPLLARYPGATLRNHQFIDTETYTIPLAPNSATDKPLTLQGDLGRHFYIINNASSLKVTENYRAALADAGFQMVSSCNLQTCGSEKQARTLGDTLSVENNVYNYRRNPYYLLAKKVLDNSEVYVALFIGAYDAEVAVQQVIVRTKLLQTDLISINADSLLQQLETDGKALIYGIYFDTGKAEVKDESQPTLEVIAQLLQQNTALTLYVVGHTDDTGSNQFNQALSKRRADAVVVNLVSKFDIAASRLQAEGVGPFAPVANNSSEAGKKLNRRVELVKKL